MLLVYLIPKRIKWIFFISWFFWNISDSITDLIIKESTPKTHSRHLVFFLGHPAESGALPSTHTKQWFPIRIPKLFLISKIDFFDFYFCLVDLKIYICIYRLHLTTKNYVLYLNLFLTNYQCLQQFLEYVEPKASSP